MNWLQSNGSIDLMDPKVQWAKGMLDKCFWIFLFDNFGWNVVEESLIQIPIYDKYFFLWLSFHHPHGVLS